MQPHGVLLSLHGSSLAAL
ncbi:MAG: hypothetical protein ACJ74Y_03910 [Bryobacteraceae bacterium]